MKNLIDKIKFIIYDKYAFKKAVFIVCLVLFALFLFLNQTYINFVFNGFFEIFSKNLQVYVLDVGQANANLIIFPNRSCMIIDTGSGESENDFLKSVEVILSANHIKQIDFLLLTHSDEDHVGGAVSLLKSYQVNNVLRPKILSRDETSENSNYLVSSTYTYASVIDAIYQEPNCRVEFIDDKSYNFPGNVSVKFFAGEEDYYKDTNSYSPFVLVNYEDCSFMFTGDASQLREDEFIRNVQGKLELDYLVVSHHGSKYSTSKLFLEKVNPKNAIISAGDDLHPSKDVLDRLQDFGVENIFVTKSVGTVSIAVETGGKVTVKTLTGRLDFAFILVLVSLFDFVYLKYLNDNKRTKFNVLRRKTIFI